MQFLTFVPLTDQIKRTTAKRITPVERENISLGNVFLYLISFVKKKANVLASNVILSNFPVVRT